MTFLMPDEWRSEIERKGTPLYLDGESGRKYVLLAITVEHDESKESYRAIAEKIPFFGIGKTKKKATRDLMKILTKLCKKFSISNP